MFKNEEYFLTLSNIPTFPTQMNYESLTLTELRMLAKEIGHTHIPLPKKKSDIVALFRQYDANEKANLAKQCQKDEEEAAHRATRIVGLRKQGAAELEAGIASLAYPFEFLRTGEYSRAITPLLGQTVEECATLDIGAFPDTIAEYFWVHTGENDEEPWLVLCRLQNGLYVFYRGECDYTGFDCQGDMRIYVARTVDMLLLHAMTAADYEKYTAETDGDCSRRHNRDRRAAELADNSYEWSSSVNGDSR